jgi:hypothetical protein
MLIKCDSVKLESATRLEQKGTHRRSTERRRQRRERTRTSAITVTVIRPARVPPADDTTTLVPRCCDLSGSFSFVMTSRYSGEVASEETLRVTSLLVVSALVHSGS